MKADYSCVLWHLDMKADYSCDIFYLQINNYGAKVHIFNSIYCNLFSFIFFEFPNIIFKLEYYFLYNFLFPSPTIFIFHLKLYYFPNLQNYELYIGTFLSGFAWNCIWTSDTHL